MNANRLFGRCIQSRKNVINEDEDVDVCSTGEHDACDYDSGGYVASVANYAVGGGSAVTSTEEIFGAAVVSVTKSPIRKNCLTATFSRMSPFKTAKISPSHCCESNNNECVNSEGGSRNDAAALKPSVRRNLFGSFKKVEATNGKSNESRLRSNDYGLTHTVISTNTLTVKTSPASSSATQSTSKFAADTKKPPFSVGGNFVTNFANEKSSKTTLANISSSTRPQQQQAQSQPRSQQNSQQQLSLLLSEEAKSEIEASDSQSFNAVDDQNTAVSEAAAMTTKKLSDVTAASTAIEPFHKAPKAPRKEKSLGNLCKRFLLTMGEMAAGAQPNDVHLESVAKKMKVEKRRIYDIVNVMEALEAMSKTNKSFYKWRGLDALPQLMHQLQKEAISAKFPEKIRQVEKAMCNFTELSAVRKNFSAGLRHSSSASITNLAAASVDATAVVEEELLSRTPSNGSLCGSLKDDLILSQASFHCNNTTLNDSSIWTEGSFNVSYDENTLELGSSVDYGAAERSNCGKNSLVHLCRRFLMMLLCDPDKRRVSLDVLSTVLIKDSTCEDFTPPDRSRCRRLYDIANVLVAMELIKKVHYLFGTKKIPLFVYCGPEPDVSPLTGELSMRRFLDRIGLAAIRGCDYDKKQESAHPQHPSSTAAVSPVEQEQRKYKTPKIAGIEKSANLKPAATKKSFTPSLPPQLCSQKFSTTRPTARNLFGSNNCSIADFSPISRSTSSYSIISALSQPSSYCNSAQIVNQAQTFAQNLTPSPANSSSTSASTSVRYLVEMADFVRKRLHPTTKSPSKTSKSSIGAESNLSVNSKTLSFADYTTNSGLQATNYNTNNNNSSYVFEHCKSIGKLEDDENKENQPPYFDQNGIKVTTVKPNTISHKRQKISATTFSALENLTPFELPKPKPVNPLMPQNLFTLQQQQLLQHQQQQSEQLASIKNQSVGLDTAAVAATMMNNILNGLVLPNTCTTGFNSTSTAFSSSGLGSSSLECGLNPFFADYCGNGSTQAGALQPSIAVSAQKQKPKVAHSVSAILGVSQTENIGNNFASQLTSSPKAFKPFSQNNNYENENNSIRSHQRDKEVSYR